MKFIKSKIAILAIVASAAGPLLAGEPYDPGNPLSYNPVRNCTWCHGSSAQGFMFAPRLAGQRDQYIENQLLRFSEHIRDNPRSRQFMWPATGNLDPQMGHYFSAYFSTLPPIAANDGDQARVEAGRAIYEVGIAESNVVACVVCHGPNAEGVREIPRLGGLSYTYLKSRLEQWVEGFDATAAPMPQIASQLSPDQIDALASYLSFVQYESLD